MSEWNMHALFSSKKNPTTSLVKGDLKLSSNSYSCNITSLIGADKPTSPQLQHSLNNPTVTGLLHAYHIFKPFSVLLSLLLKAYEVGTYYSHFRDNKTELSNLPKVYTESGEA